MKRGEEGTSTPTNSVAEGSAHHHHYHTHPRSLFSTGSSASPSLSKTHFYSTFSPPRPQGQTFDCPQLALSEVRKPITSPLFPFPPPRVRLEGNSSLSSYPGRAKALGLTSSSAGGSDKSVGDQVTGVTRLTSPLTESAQLCTLSPTGSRSVASLLPVDGSHSRTSFLTSTTTSLRSNLSLSWPSFHSSDRSSTGTTSPSTPSTPPLPPSPPLSSTSTATGVVSDFTSMRVPHSRSHHSAHGGGPHSNQEKRDQDQQRTNYSIPDVGADRGDHRDGSGSQYPPVGGRVMVGNEKNTNRTNVLLPPSPLRPVCISPSPNTSATEYSSAEQISVSLPVRSEGYDIIDTEAPFSERGEKLSASAPCSPSEEVPPLILEGSHSKVSTPPPLGGRGYHSASPSTPPLPPPFGFAGGKDKGESLSSTHLPESNQGSGGSSGSFIFQRSHSTGTLGVGSNSLFSSSSNNNNGSVNGRMNAAFCLSPRTLRTEDSLSESSSGSNDGRRQLMVLLLDEKSPHQKVYCDVSSAEERQKFLSCRVFALLQHMTSFSIVRSLIPVIVACLENDDQYHDQADENSVELVSKCLPIVFDAVNPQDDLSHCAAFLMPLLHLCTGVERRSIPTVTEALCLIIEKMSPRGVVELILPLVQQLRYSTCSLIRAIAAGVLHSIAGKPKVLQMTNKTIDYWYGFFQESIQDLNPIVREACVGALPGWVKVALLHNNAFSNLLAATFQSLISDDLSDVVRFLLVDRLAEIGNLIGKVETSRILLPLFDAAVKGRSWRVRYRAARALKAFTAQLEHSEETILSAASRFSKDEEVEIRAVMAAQIGDFVPFVSPAAAKEKLLRHALRLASDTSRVVLLQVIGNLAPFASIDKEMADVVSSELTSAIKKNEDRLQECAVSSMCSTIKILRHANTVEVSSRSESGNSPGGYTNKLPGIVGNHQNGDRIESSFTSRQHIALPRETQQLLESFANALKHMSRSGAWRVREAVLPGIPELSYVLSMEQFESMNVVLRELLVDPVSKVRKTAAETLRKTAECAGPAWAANMMNELLVGDLGTILQKSYAWRVLTVRCLSALLPTATHMNPRDPKRAVLLEKTLQILTNYADDAVPIVQHCLAESLMDWHSWFESFSGSTPRPFSSGISGSATGSASKRLANYSATTRSANSNLWPVSSSGGNPEVDVMRIFHSVVKSLQARKHVLAPQLTQIGGCHERQPSGGGDTSSFSSRASSSFSCSTPSNVRLSGVPAHKRSNSSSTNSVSGKNNGLKR